MYCNRYCSNCFNISILKVKDSNRISGQGRSSYPFYEEIDAILGTRAASSTAVLLESSEGLSGNNDTSGKQYILNKRLLFIIEFTTILFVCIVVDADELSDATDEQCSASPGEEPAHHQDSSVTQLPSPGTIIILNNNYLSLFTFGILV